MWTLVFLIQPRTGKLSRHFAVVIYEPEICTSFVVFDLGPPLATPQFRNIIPIVLNILLRRCHHAHFRFFKGLS